MPSPTSWLPRLQVRQDAQQERAHWHLHPPRARSHYRAVQAEEEPLGVKEENRVGWNGTKWKKVHSSEK